MSEENSETHQGGCLCGAVRFVATGVKTTHHACHCDTCRGWSGGPFLGCHAASVEFEGADNIARYDSSDWAQRGFCKTCGSNLFYFLKPAGTYSRPRFLSASRHGPRPITACTTVDSPGVTSNQSSDDCRYTMNRPSPAPGPDGLTCSGPADSPRASASAAVPNSQLPYGSLQRRTSVFSIVPNNKSTGAGRATASERSRSANSRRPRGSTGAA
ncbi:MAG: hypothetical protein ACI9OJ_001502 [Myxococcota bacterium]|jgi:hypothetical protein